MNADEPARYQGRRSNADDLPPYAPRPPAAPPVVQTPPAAEAATAPMFSDSPTLGRVGVVGPDHDAAEEAAAFAEAQEQGISTDRAWTGGVDAAAFTAQFPPIQPEPPTIGPPAATAPGPEKISAEPNDAEPNDAALNETGGDETDDASRPESFEPESLEPEPVAPPAESPPPRRGFRQDPIRTLALVLGQTLITLGAIVLLFVVYEVYVTDLFGHQKQEAVKSAMENRWTAAESSAPTSTSTSAATTTTTSPPAAEQVTDPAQRTRKYQTAIGQGFANIYIPALGADYSYTVVEGTTVDDLYGNPGHYDDSQYPGELGNFAVAGHRVSKGSPFNALGTLNSCDAIVIETQDDWFVYRVLPMAEEVATWNPASNPQCADVKPLDGQYTAVTGREITSPSDYAQVLPIPQVSAAGPGAVAAATRRIITLTTCHPQFSDAQRMIIHGVLVQSYAKAAGFLPPELSEG